MFRGFLLRVVSFAFVSSQDQTLRFLGSNNQLFSAPPLSHGFSILSCRSHQNPPAMNKATAVICLILALATSVHAQDIELEGSFPFSLCSGMLFSCLVRSVAFCCSLLACSGVAGAPTDFNVSSLAVSPNPPVKGSNIAMVLTGTVGACPLPPSLPLPLPCVSSCL